MFERREASVLCLGFFNRKERSQRTGGRHRGGKGRKRREWNGSELTGNGKRVLSGTGEEAKEFGESFL